MPDIATLIQQGSSNLWLFIPAAIVLGALHGLEPGHSKTMMAAFIIAIRGTVWQAVLLGLGATISHTAIVWIIALAGLHFGSQFNTAATEPYLQLVSAVLIIGVALWMAWRTWREQNYQHHHHHHDHGHDHHHDHHHDHDHGETRIIDTGHGRVSLAIVENGVPPRWQLQVLQGAHSDPGEVSVTTVRHGGEQQVFKFESTGGVLQSVDEIPEPHEFDARVTLSHHGHSHVFNVSFAEHTHDDMYLGLDDSADAHERAHAEEIKRRFANHKVTTGQIVMFGLTGGLIPCPASITVLLLCLQLKQIAMGATLVLSFSVGLAITMVSVGAIAALSVHHLAVRWGGFTTLMRRAPYVSSALIIMVGLYTGYLGWKGLI